MMIIGVDYHPNKTPDVFPALRFGETFIEFSLSAFPCRLKGMPLISSTVKNVEDICAVAGLAVVERYFPAGKHLDALRAARNGR
jgi:hypothetical protein